MWKNENNDFLLQIDSETIEAQRKANETDQKVNQLNDKLLTLQKNFLKNDLDAKEIQEQANKVRDSASNAHDLATKVIKIDYLKLIIKIAFILFFFYFSLATKFISFS